MNIPLLTKARLALLAILWVAAVYLLIAYAPREQGRKIDCSLAEFHPDFTPKMREQCRLVRGHKL